MNNNADNVLKKLPFGISNFATIIRENCYYVDKTLFIKEVIEDARPALFIARPRLFGKTLAMDTLSAFLRINPDNPGDTSYQDALFSQTQIYEDKEFCHKYMGKYPVLSLSLKDVDGNCFQDARGMLTYAISELAKKHRYLLDSTKLTSVDKENFSVLLDDDLLDLPQNSIFLRNSLEMLTEMLFNHLGKQVIVLINDCDIPLANSCSGGYYKDMASLLRSLFSSVLERNKALQKGVLTGSLRVSNENILRDYYNLEENNVVNDIGIFSDFFGFTPQEVAAMLDYYGLSEQKDAVKDWYDGYRIGGSELYCPWEVIRFCDDAMTDRRYGNKILSPSSYWAEAGGTAVIRSVSDVIQQFMACLDVADAERMQALLDGGEAEIVLNPLVKEDMGDLHRSDDFWPLFLFTGYLTCLNVARGGEYGTVCKVRIPNKEIRVALKAYISDYYKTDRAIAASSQKIADAFFAGDADKVSLLLESRLRNFVSIRDMAVKAPTENYYHGFLNCIFSPISRNFLHYMPNAVAGDGYADIVFSSKDGVGVVIERRVLISSGTR